MLRGLKQNLVHTRTRTQGPHNRLSQTCFEYLNIFCGGTGQQWSARGTGALATADVGGMVCESHHRTVEQKTYNLKNNYTKGVFTELQKF